MLTKIHNYICVLNTGQRRDPRMQSFVMISFTTKLFLGEYFGELSEAISQSVYDLEIFLNL
jgi:hypothetical protein